MTEFKLIAYEKENGEVPVEEFLDSVNLLKRLADGMGMALKIEFVPKQKA